MSGIWADLFGFRRHWVDDSVVVVGGTAAAAPTIIDPVRLPAGSWLSTHYALDSMLTWLDVIQIIGALGVVVGIVKFAISAYLAVRRRSLEGLG